MKTVFLLITLLAFGTMAVHAQSTKEKLQQVKADPKTKERAAKADVYVAKNTSIVADTSAPKLNTPNNTPSSAKKKKKKGK